MGREKKASEGWLCKETREELFVFFLLEEGEAFLVMKRGVKRKRVRLFWS